MGNVGDDPKVNQINDTAKVARFPLATNEVYLTRKETRSRKLNGTRWYSGTRPPILSRHMSARAFPFTSREKSSPPNRYHIRFEIKFVHRSMVIGL